MKHFSKMTLLVLILLLASGCASLLGGQGSNVFIPDEKDPIGSGGGNGILVADGFDFPVGGRNGQGWAVTGYDFMQWSNFSNSWHPGEDWNIPGAGNGDFGEPVYSIGHGVVVYSGWNTAQGNIIQIEHTLADGSQVWSQYSHLDKRLAATGETVWRRQQIGTVGRGPNNSFTAHLHFEIRKLNMPSNAWPRTNGQPWTRAKALEHYLHPTRFIQQNRP